MSERCLDRLVIQDIECAKIGRSAGPTERGGRRWLRRLTVVGAVLALVSLGACGGDDGGSGDDGGGTMRFVFSPDPVWNWLEDEGILAEMEAGVRVPHRAQRVRGRVRVLRRRTRRHRLDGELRDAGAGGRDRRRDRDDRQVQQGEGHRRRRRRLGLRDVRRPRAGLQARRRVVQRLHDRVAGARPGPPRAHDRRGARGHPDGDHRLQHGGGPRAERGPLRRASRRSTTRCRA